MTYQIEVYCVDSLGAGTWRAVRPTSKAARKIQTRPYSFKTETDARDASRLCYDGDASRVRIVNTCDHRAGFPYSGKVPCTGPRLCPVCGARYD